MAGYGMSNYLVGLSSAGPGIRRQQYSYNMAIDPITLNAYNTAAEVHDAGEIWCSALWDMTWLLIDQYGFSSNLQNGYTGPGTPAMYWRCNWCSTP